MTQRYGYVILSLLLVAAVGCTGEFIPGTGNGVGGNVDAAPPAGTPQEQAFNTDVAPLLGACAMCHQAPSVLGPTFMGSEGAGDDYVSVKAHTAVAGPLVTPGNPDASQLYLYGLHGNGGNGNGTFPGIPDASKPLVAAWINMELP